MRLTSDMRSTTVTNIIKARLTDEYLAIADRIETSAQLIYDTYIPVIVKELPGGICPTYNYISLKIGDDYVSLRFNGVFDVKDEQESYHYRADWSHYFCKREHVAKPFPYNRGGQCVAELSSGHRMYSQYKELIKDTQGFTTKFFTTRSKLRGVVNSVTTVQKLIEVWPEVKPYIAEEAPKPQLPALPISELNQMLRLP